MSWFLGHVRKHSVLKHLSYTRPGGWCRHNQTTLWHHSCQLKFSWRKGTRIVFTTLATWRTNQSRCSLRISMFSLVRIGHLRGIGDNKLVSLHLILSSSWKKSTVDGVLYHTYPGRNFRLRVLSVSQDRQSHWMRLCSRKIELLMKLSPRTSNFRICHFEKSSHVVRKVQKQQSRTPKWVTTHDVFTPESLWNKKWALHVSILA